MSSAAASSILFIILFFNISLRDSSVNSLVASPILLFNAADKTARLKMLSDTVFNIFNFRPTNASPFSPDVLASRSAASRNNLEPSTGKVSLNIFDIALASYGFSKYLATSPVPVSGFCFKFSILSNALTLASTATLKLAFILFLAVVAGCDVILPNLYLSKLLKKLAAPFLSLAICFA